MIESSYFIVMIYWIVFLCVFVGLSNSSRPVDDYAIVIDAGSTGSRCFVFHVTLDENDTRNVSSFSCGKVIPGLSSFVTYPQEVASYMAPLLINAATIIPRAFQLKTSVFIKATAGMRLLSPETQSQLWKNLVNGLNQRLDIPFLIVKQNIGTIDGHAEAFFAVLASNYIAGSIDGNLHPIEGMPMLGALDMGGSSTQLIFYNGTNDARKVHANDFWSHSWLNYGVHRIHQRVLDYIYNTNLPDLKQLYNNDTDEKCQTYIIPNPCGFKGHRQPYLSQTIFEGTGEGEKCFHIIEKVIWPDLSAQDKQIACLRGRPCPIDEIEHPSVHGHHFYAMSVYYFALDCMRLLGPSLLPNWPTPNLQELEEAAVSFCGLEWDSLLREFKESKPHPYTREGQLQDRCFEALYIITLLEKGFAFDRFSRTITYALEVEGNEVEWTLGFALAEVDFRPHHDKPLIPTTVRITWKYLLYGALKGIVAPFVSVYYLIKSSLQTAEEYAIYAMNKGRGTTEVLLNLLSSVRLKLF